MKAQQHILAFCAMVTILFTSINTNAQKVTKFEYMKGINIGAWLAQTSVKSGPARLNYFTQKDLNQLASLGFDHIRLPFHENQLYTANGERIAESFTIIDNVVEWCRQANMRVILDCHQTLVHDYANFNSITLFKNPAAQDSLVTLWEKLSTEFKKYPNELAAYEILNEPLARESSKWNDVQMRVYKVIRKLEPSRVIFFGSNKSNRPSTFPELEYPKNDPNIILSFHFYDPYFITHNKTSYMSKLKGIDIPLNYPGLLVSDSVVNTLNEAAKKIVMKHNGIYNKEKLFEMIKPALEVAKASGLRIHCGEFGSNFIYPDRSVQFRWLQDVVAILKENNIPYTYWGYRKTFGVFNDDRSVKDQAYLDVLVK